VILFDKLFDSCDKRYLFRYYSADSEDGASSTTGADDFLLEDFLAGASVASEPVTRAIFASNAFSASLALAFATFLDCSLIFSAAFFSAFSLASSSSFEVSHIS
jgi:hypothetical protein